MLQLLFLDIMRGMILYLTRFPLFIVVVLFALILILSCRPLLEKVFIPWVLHTNTLHYIAFNIFPYIRITFLILL